MSSPDPILASILTVPPASSAGGNGSVNDLPDRAAMGLPDHVVERVPADAYERNADLLTAGPAALAATVEDASVPFVRRLVAGRLLAIVGDPRIRPDDPVLVDVPGGRARIGLPAEQVDDVLRRWGRVGVLRDWIEKECPQYEVDLPPVRMMRYLVTNGEYRRFLADTGRPELPTSWRFGVYRPERANEPVWTVTEQAADAYARWLSERTGRAFRLPREAEWEHAARGDDDREFPWGDEFLPDHANTVDDGPLTPTPVGCYPAGRSPYGCDDMAGNVEEWVADDYAPYPGGTHVADDLALSKGSYRIARGGSFTRFGDLARTRRRHGRYARDIYAIGFRLVEDVGPRSGT